VEPDSATKMLRIPNWAGAGFAGRRAVGPIPAETYAKAMSQQLPWVGDGMGAVKLHAEYEE